MDEPTHVIDPDGEVIIVLKDANPPFAVWSDKVEENSEAPKTCVQRSETEGEIEEGEEQEGCFRIRVSAKHLTLASPVFKSLLLGGWKESITFLDKKYTELVVSGWDLDAFLIFLRVLHCQNKEVPRKIDTELFAKIAVLVDYYACKDAMGFYADAWYSKLKENIYLSANRGLMLWLCISWVFKIPEVFRRSTICAIDHQTRKISSLGLPIPANLIDDLNEQRERAIQSVMTALQRQRSIFLADSWACTYSFQCTSMMLGGLEKQMSANGLSPMPTAPFVGFGYRDLVDKISKFSPPVWYDEKCHNNSYSIKSHSCVSSAKGYEQLKLSLGSAAKLNIHDYSSDWPAENWSTWM